MIKETLDDNIIIYIIVYDSSCSDSSLRPAFHRRRCAQIAPWAHLHSVVLLLLLLLLLLVEHNRFDAGRARRAFRTAFVWFYRRRRQRS